ncbi:response regulator [Pokkaliibacter sp. CJK22405]|uniref:response regulator n=1 Tax=Pokkaliibacter sp. CJK22405 TaxID=3384615 RepID=UPI00398478F1
MAQARLDLTQLAILLIEPSSLQRKLIKEALQDAGCTQVEAVEDLPQAIEIIERYPPDVVISALYLPSGTGTDLITDLRRRSGTDDVAFILISSESKLEHLEPIRQAGAIAILPKPFSVKALNRALEATLDYFTEEEVHLENYDIAELKVLVVDDSSMSRKHIARVLTNMGIHEITMAENGMEALNLLQEDTFNLVVTDYNMPEMDGAALVSGIRDNAELSHIPIMMITSEQDESRLSAVRQAGVDAICDKPFDLNELRRMMHLMLDQ